MIDHEVADSDQDKIAPYKLRYYESGTRDELKGQLTLYDTTEVTQEAGAHRQKGVGFEFQLRKLSNPDPAEGDFAKRDDMNLYAETEARARARVRDVAARRRAPPQNRSIRDLTLAPHPPPRRLLSPQAERTQWVETLQYVIEVCKRRRRFQERESRSADGSTPNATSAAAAAAAVTANLAAAKQPGGAGEATPSVTPAPSLSKSPSKSSGGFFKSSKKNVSKAAQVGAAAPLARRERGRG